MSKTTETIADLLAFGHEQTLKTAERVPDEKRLVQPRDGKAHPLWLVGHLANTANVVMLQWTLNGDSITPKGFGKKFAPDFGGGDPIVSDPAQYPSWDEVIRIYAEAMNKAIDGIRTLDDAVLPDPLPGRIPDPLRSFFSSVGRTLQLMVNHDAYHRGQIGLLAAL